MKRIANIGPSMKRTRFLDAAALLYSACEFNGAYSPPPVFEDRGPPRRDWDKGGGEDEREGDSWDVTMRRWRDMVARSGGRLSYEPV